MKRKKLIAALMLLSGIYGYAQDTKTVKLQHEAQGLSNYSVSMVYYNNGDTYNLLSRQISESDPIYDILIDPTGQIFAVLTKSKNGKKHTLSTYNLWAKDDMLASNSKLGFVPTKLAFDNNGTWLLVADDAGNVHIINTNKLVERGQFNLQAPAKILKTSVTNQMAAAHDNTVEVFDVTNREKLKDIKVPDIINDIVYSADGKMLGVLINDGTLKVYDTNDFTELYNYDALGTAEAVSFTPNSQYVGVVTGPSRVSIINVVSPQKREYVETINDGNIKKMLFIKSPAESKSYLMYEDGNNVTFVDVTALSPMRSQLLADKLNEKMLAWEQQLPGESLEDFALRVNDQTRLEQSKLFEQELLGEMVLSELGITSIETGNYNNDLQLMELKLKGGLNDIFVTVPMDEISSFLDPGNLEFSNTVFTINKEDEFVILYTDVYNKDTGKTYSYNNMEGQYIDYIVDETEFVPVEILHNAILEEASLANLTQDIVEEAKNMNILSDHTHIAVETAVVNAVDKDGLDIRNYEVMVSYTVDAEFSAKEDYPAGKYVLKDSPAGTAMIKIVKNALSEDFAKYLKDGREVIIEITGTADSSPIRGVIAYNGVYGDFKNEPVIFDSKPSTITVNKKGITTNEQLAFLRAVGVKEYLFENVPQLNNMDTHIVYNIGVSEHEGSEFRKVGLKFTFVDAFAK